MYGDRNGEGKAMAMVVVLEMQWALETLQSVLVAVAGLPESGTLERQPW